ncbi:chemotaxis protein MotC [Rhizobium gallicum]|uniref:Chemotaxis protein MotC n=1 Tax=Rhizobium gallicum TaxID=56730 RepID=A0A1L5NEU5_9HYPH|nr:chemotaxis protein MotC [Rhizobium gallicum]APO66424.1 chemotaxis protein MotC [Rhizobium gallicum]
MARPQHRHLLLALGLAIASPAVAAGEDQANLAPYKMLRSLQFVQDSVALGDHSAAQMQRFMLGTIDQRLRSADASVFDDDRNVDAALVYAMSGGNPATLEYLIARDVNGYFDTRVTDVLRKYLSGKGLLVAKTLVETANEYRDKKIGPYLALVGGNVMVARSPDEALKLYDQARLSAPGTIVEEAALRRSVAICVEAGLLDKGLAYSQRYVRRFLHSPYASQFADLFVKLIVDHVHVKTEDIVSILSFMDESRRREVYLRIARAAGIAGKAELARTAAAYAQSLAGEPNNALGALADFYGNMALVSTPDVGAAAKSIKSVADSELSPRDRALRAAAKSIAEQVLQPPDPASLTQASDSKPANEEITSEQAAVSTADGSQPAEIAAPSRPADDGVAPALMPDGAGQEADPSFKSFVTTSRSKLDEIDGLLSQESN